MTRDFVFVWSALVVGNVLSVALGVSNWERCVEFCYAQAFAVVVALLHARTRKVREATR